MKRIYLLILFIAGIAWSCEEQDNTYQGPPLVELAQSFRGGSNLYTVSGPGQTFMDQTLIQLVAPPQKEAINVVWELDADNTTAIEGIHYNIVSATSLTIPAGENSVGIQFEVIGDGFSGPDEVVTLAFNLVSADVTISENYKSAEVELSITCPSELVGTYTYVSTAEPGSATFWNGTGTVTMASGSDAGVYTLSDYANGAFGDPRSMTLLDVCNAISGADGTTGRVDSGSVDPDTGVITIRFELTCCGFEGNMWTYVMTPQ